MINQTFKEFINIDIFEMTMLSGSDMKDIMPFPDFNKFELKFEGKMQHGYDVYSFHHVDTIIYGVKIEKEFASFVQLREIEIPKIGKVLESLNSKTKKEFAGHLLSYKLRLFLDKHLGKSILLGDVHSIATENILKKLTMFNKKMVNIKTGELKDWTEKLYKDLSSKIKATDWRVLLIGSDQPFNEDIDRFMGYAGEPDRHMWTYLMFFEEPNERI